MKTKYYTGLLLPISIFCAIFRVLELVFAIEYNIDSYFFKTGSVIPAVFNIYIIICVAFYLSYWVIYRLKEIFSPERRKENEERKAKIRRLKASGKYEQYLKNEKASKQNYQITTDFTRFKKLEPSTTIAFVVASVLILTFAIKLLFSKLDAGVLSLANPIGILKTVYPYLIITAILSVLFFIQFSSSPRAACKGKFWLFISFVPSIFFSLTAFEMFIENFGIIGKVFLSYDFIGLAAIIATVISLSRLMISTDRKEFFLSAACISVIFSVIRLTDMVMLLAVNLRLDEIFPISELNKIEGEPLLIVGNFLLSIALLGVSKRLFRKNRKKPLKIDGVEVDTTETRRADK